MSRLAEPIRRSRAARSRQPRPPIRVPYALLYVVMGIGAALLCASLIGFWLDERVRAWPSAPGHLLSVDIRYDTVGVDVGRYANTPTPVREQRFHVRYSYEVAGTSYFGSQIGAHAVAARVSGQHDRYRVGQALLVRYNSDDPHQAVIETPFPTTSALGIGLGVLLLIGSFPVYTHRLRVLRPRTVDRDA